MASQRPGGDCVCSAPLGSTDGIDALQFILVLASWILPHDIRMALPLGWPCCT